MRDSGSFLLHRSFFETWEWRDDRNVRDVFLDILGNVCYKEHRYKGVTYYPGQLTTSIAAISERNKFLTYDMIRLALKKLKKTKEITSINKGKFLLITVINWKKYQNFSEKTQPDPLAAAKKLPTLNKVYKISNKKPPIITSIERKDRAPHEERQTKMLGYSYLDEPFEIKNQTPKIENDETTRMLVEKFFTLFSLKVFSSTIEKNLEPMKVHMSKFKITPEEMELAINNKQLVLFDPFSWDGHKKPCKLETFLNTLEKFLPENFKVETFYDFEKTKKNQEQLDYLEYKAAREQVDYEQSLIPDMESPGAQSRRIRKENPGMSEDEISHLIFRENEALCGR